MPTFTTRTILPCFTVLCLLQRLVVLLYTHSPYSTATFEQKELRWWAENRAVRVKSPHDSAITHLVYHYNVEADGPRPEVRSRVIRPLPAKLIYLCAISRMLKIG